MQKITALYQPVDEDQLIYICTMYLSKKIKNRHRRTYALSYAFYVFITKAIFNPLLPQSVIFPGIANDKKRLIRFKRKKKKRSQ